MSNLDYSTGDIGDLARLAGRAEVGLTHGPLPARVVAYDAATQRVNVQPVIGVETDVAGVYAPAPVMQGVPVAWPAWTGGSVTWPLSVGSWVMLVPQDADVSAWAQAGTTGQAPPTPRSCAWSDCIALPLCGVPASAPLAALAYAADGTVLAGTVYLGGSTATDFAAMAGKVLTELQAVKNAFDNHVHGGGTLANTGGTVTGVTGVPGTAPLGTPALPMPAPSSVACTKAKVL